MHNESVQEYSAELKRLYDKGFPRRDKVTRQEDLLRAFFLGLQDDDADHRRNRLLFPAVSAKAHLAVLYVTSRVGLLQPQNDLSRLSTFHILQNFIIGTRCTMKVCKSIQQS
jgi:hypothetical protein